MWLNHCLQQIWGQIPSLPSTGLVLPAAKETRLSTMQVKHKHRDWREAAGSLQGDASSAVRCCKSPFLSALCKGILLASSQREAPGGGRESL